GAVREQDLLQAMGGVVAQHRGAARVLHRTQIGQRVVAIGCLAAVGVRLAVDLTVGVVGVLRDVLVGVGRAEELSDRIEGVALGGAVGVERGQQVAALVVPILGRVAVGVG